MPGGRIYPSQSLGRNRCDGGGQGKRCMHDDLQLRPGAAPLLGLRASLRASKIGRARTFPEPFEDEQKPGVEGRQH